MIGLTVLVRTIYASAMPKTFVFQLKGHNAVTKVDADEAELYGAYWQLRVGGKVVANFKDAEIQAWWLDEAKSK